VDLLVGLLIVLMVLALTTIGSVVGLHWYLSHRNRVTPRVPSPAPLTWLWSPSTPARTHRRLRTAAATARSVPRDPEAPSLSAAALSVDLEQHAVALDEWVVWTARAPRRWRRDHYRAIRSQVYDLETLSVRLTMVSSALPRFPADDRTPPLAAAREQVEQLEQAHAELRALERLTVGQDLPTMPARPASGAQPSRSLTR
jgi:hypothetical protein